MKEKLLKSWQIRIFVLCWLAYASIYFGRVNLSVAIPEIQNTFGWSKGQIGLVGSIFFWVYGLGQLINGYIGDKVSSRIFIFIGLLVTALTNIFFGFSTSLIIMILIWTVNGYFQSMLWGPLVKTLSNWFSHEKRTSISISISTSIVGGYLLAWGLSGQILTHTNWQWTFWVPGIAILIFSFIWYWGMRNHPRDIGFESPNVQINSPTTTTSANKFSLTLWQVIYETKLWFVVIACFAQGLIKDGIAFWGPTFLMETQNLDMKSTVNLILLIPIMNFAGMILAGWLNKKFNNQDKLSIITLLTMGLVMIIGLVQFGSSSAGLGLLFLSLSSAMMYGANTLLLSNIPMGFAKYNKASSVAGFLNFFCYLAAGVGTSITGLIVDIWEWNGVLTLWVILAIIGMSSLVISWADERKDALEETRNLVKS